MRIAATSARSAAAKREGSPFDNLQPPAKATLRAKDLRTRRKHFLRVSSSPVPPQGPYFFFSFGPCTARFLFFFWQEKEKMGGAMNQPSLVSIPSRPKGE